MVPRCVAPTVANSVSAENWLKVTFSPDVENRCKNPNKENISKDNIAWTTYFPKAVYFTEYYFILYSVNNPLSKSCVFHWILFQFKSRVYWPPVSPNVMQLCVSLMSNVVIKLPSVLTWYITMLAGVIAPCSKSWNCPVWYENRDVKL